jgi:hypothetical protein
MLIDSRLPVDNNQFFAVSETTASNKSLEVFNP